MVQINNNTAVSAYLQALDKEQQALFGTMSPQQMVEHLLFFVEMSLGQHPQTAMLPEEQLARTKDFLVVSDQEIKPGIQMPRLPGEPESLQYPDLPSAIAALEQSLQQFATASENAIHIHPVMGSVTHQEWAVFHNKHFTHHFRQFGLI